MKLEVAHEYRVTQPLNASLAELAGDVLGGLPDQAKELLDVLEAAAAFEDESGRGMKCRLMRLDEHEAVEGRFLADSPWEPLERMRDAVDDLIRRSPLVEVSHSDLFVFAVSHLGARF